MNIGLVVNMLRKTIGDNAPTILTGFAVTGVVSTAVMAVRATPKAMHRLDVERNNRTKNAEKYTLEFSKLEVIKLAWTPYIPAVIMGTATIVCIVGSNTVNSRRNAALAGAYSLADTAFREYREKVASTLGEKPEQKVRDAVAKDRIDRQPVRSNEVVITGAGEQLCYDSLTARYFKSDIETIKKAQNELNANLVFNMYASQNDFYELIGLPPASIGEELGWRVENMLEIRFSTALSSDGRPCLSLEYDRQPIRDYYSEH